jgi:hypothetical protein
MYFYLPDTGIDPGTLQVFIEDAAGTYVSAEAPVPRRYRLATYNDAVLDSEQGFVSLKSAVKGRVLVFYKKNGLSVGSPTIGTQGFVDVGVAQKRDPAAPVTFLWTTPNYFVAPSNFMSIRQVSIPGVGDALLLWEPGDNSPFEIDSSYAFSATPPADVSKINIKLHSKNAAVSPPTNIIFQPDPANKRFLALQNKDIRATFYNFYPFPDTTGLIYGPNRDSLSGGLDYDIFVQMLTPVNEMVLEPNIEAGSVQVTINGVPETRFEVEPTSGKVTLKVDVLPTDRIEVTYRKAEQGISGGDIVFAWRDTIPLSDFTDLSLSAGIRWNANPWTYSQEPYSKSGTAIATVGINGKTDTLDYKAEAGFSYTNPDTTGILRLFGMEGNLMEVDVSEDNAYPASDPSAEIAGLGNRGRLYYRDYREYGAFGSSTLNTIESAAPPQMPYASGNRMGPYNVKGSSGNLNGVNLVFEYDLAGANDWVGAQIPVSSGSDVDLSQARALTVRMRALGLGGAAVNVYLQIGSISEDLDASGVLKAEVASTDTGFGFVDGDNGVTLKVGAGPKLEGNGKLDSEDTNANGILDLEDAFRVVTPTTGQFPVPSGTLTSSWQNFTCSLNDTDRQKLLKARSVRIVIRSTGLAATGKIVIDSLTIEGTPFWPTDRTNVQVRETPESFAQTAPIGGTLAGSFKETYNRFHPNGESNQVLETVWAGSPSAFDVQGFVPQGTGGIQYETVVSYVRTTNAQPLTFSLLDSAGKGIAWTVTLGDGKWHEVMVSRGKNHVQVDGTNVGPPDRFDGPYGSLAQFKVTVTGPGVTGGALYIDEIYLADPKGVVGAAFVGSLSAKFPGMILSAGKLPILANVALRQDLALYSAGFAPLYGVPYAAEDLSSRSHVDADILYAKTSVDLLLRDQGGSTSAAGGHRVTIPNVSSPVTVTDAFSLSTTGGFTRENIVLLSAGSAATLSFDANASAAPDETDTSGLLTQTWLAGLTFAPFPPFGISSTLSLSQALAGYTLADDWYGARWAREYGLLLPWQGGDDVSRAEKLGFKAGIPAAPFGVTLEAETSASGSNYAASAYRQENDLSAALSFLLKLGAGESSDSIGLTYRRAVSLQTAPSPGPRFEQETSELSRVLSLQGYFLEGIPFVEIFSDNTATVLPAWDSASAGQGTYSPSVSLSYQRAYGSRLTDLFIPSGVDLAVGQDLRRAADLVQTVTYVRPKVSTRAVNLFGQLGSTPRLPRVMTDEYSFSVSASIDRTTPPVYPQYGGGPILSNLSLQAYATLTGENSSQLTFVETLRRDQASTVVFSNDAQALLEWRVVPAAGIPLPLVPVDIGATGRFEHRESIDVTIGYNDSGTFHPFTLLLGHATSIVYPDHGSIKASLNLGMDVEDLLSVGLAWRFAFRAALEAKLTF